MGFRETLENFFIYKENQIGLYFDHLVGTPTLFFKIERPQRDLVGIAMRRTYGEA
jgi:hypothetical protein